MDLLRLNFKSLKLCEDVEITDETIKPSSTNNKGDKVDKKSLRIITLEEVTWHDQLDDCWLVIYDYVYDCTKFINHHPGGQDVLMEYAGRDATLAFVGAGHSDNSRIILDNYLIGELPEHERLFRIPGGIKIV